VALALAALPVAITLVSEWVTGVMPANGVRAASAVPLGIVIAWIIVRVSTTEGSVELH
jgi:hypothetical protein